MRIGSLSDVRRKAPARSGFVPSPTGPTVQYTTDLLVKYMSQNASYIGLATIQNNYTIEDMAVSAVRLIFANHETTARTINKAIVAFHYGMAADGFTPLNAQGVADNTLWQPIASATGLVNAAAPSAGTSPNFDRAYTATDWTPATSVGSGLRGFSVRTYGNITQNSLTGSLDTSGVAGGTWATIDQGRHLTSCFKFSSDGVTTPGSWTGVTFNSAVAPAVVEFRTTRGVSVAGWGDSLTQGFNTTSAHNAWGFKGCVLASTAAKPVTWANFGVSGTLSTNFYQEALKGIVGPHKPSVLLFPVNSPNDTSSNTQPTLDAAWARAQDIVARCKAAGIVPVLWGPTPFSSAAANNLPYRAQRDRAKTWCAANGVPFFDAYAVLENPGTPDTLLPAYNSGDGHPNDAGTTAMGQGFYSTVLQPLLAVG